MHAWPLDDSSFILIPALVDILFSFLTALSFHCATGWSSCVVCLDFQQSDLVFIIGYDLLLGMIVQGLLVSF